MSASNTPPRDAVSRYLKDRRPEISDKTHYNYSSTLRQFCDWLEEHDHYQMGDVDSNVIQQFKEYRLEQVSLITCKNDMVTIRGFIEFCETIKAVPKGLGEMVQVPSTSEEDEINDDFVTESEATQLLGHLEKYEYATSRHIVVLILWKTGMRVSGVRSLDVDDFKPDKVGPDGYPMPTLELRHRPDSGTTLKRKSKSERDVIITEKTAEIIQDWIDDQRPDVTDKNGREPLVASTQGRMHNTSIAKQAYTATRPCTYNGGECPFDEDPETCDYNSWATASQCPGSVSPHAFRRGYVTAARNNGMAKDVTGERVNMSGRVLDKHYDKGDHAEKAARRREHIKNF